MPTSPIATSDSTSQLSYIIPATASVFFFFSLYCDHPDLHSFPTRRSSDLLRGACENRVPHGRQRRSRPVGHRRSCPRSEEHTSELQSRAKLVCRLLIDK